MDKMDRVDVVESGTAGGHQVEVRVVCPRCGSGRYVSDGSAGRVVYRKCLVCAHRGKVVRVLSSEVVRVEVKA